MLGALAIATNFATADVPDILSWIKTPLNAWALVGVLLLAAALLSGWAARVASSSRDDEAAHYSGHQSQDDARRSNRIQRDRGRLIASVKQDLAVLRDTALGEMVRLEFSVDALPLPWELNDSTSEELRSLPALPLVFDPIELFNATHGKLCLVGPSGSGKSHQLRKLAGEAAQRAEANPLSPVPLLLSASQYEAETDLLRWVVKSVSLRYQIDEFAVARWLLDDDAIVLLDDVEELGPGELATLFRSIGDFLEGHPQRSIALAVQPLTLAVAARLPERITYIDLLPPEPSVVRRSLANTGQHRRLLDGIAHETVEVLSNPLIYNAAAMTLTDTRHRLRGSETLTREIVLNDWLEDALDRAEAAAAEPTSTLSIYLQWLARLMTSRSHYFYMSGMYDLGMIADSQARKILRTYAALNALLGLAVGMGCGWFLTGSTAVVAILGAIGAALFALAIRSIGQDMDATSAKPAEVEPERRFAFKRLTELSFWEVLGSLFAILVTIAFPILTQISSRADPKIIAMWIIVIMAGLWAIGKTVLKREVVEESHRLRLDTKEEPAGLIFGLGGMAIGLAGGSITWLLIATIRDINPARHRDVWLLNLAAEYLHFVDATPSGDLLNASPVLWLVVVGVITSIVSIVAGFSLVHIMLAMSASCGKVVLETLGLRSDPGLNDKAIDSLRRNAVIHSAGWQYQFGHERIRKHLAGDLFCVPIDKKTGRE
ncbi:hypothetical protein [Actinomycetospora atypica]|uniref:AAA+ ATPase domain-containing protein n=1 Tax=Actinomycetospora atypica TaxID=1290095 RepID=A0ABV9YH29_9PSEU